MRKDERHKLREHVQVALQPRGQAGEMCARSRTA
jgi:hypothetical protein